MARRLSAYLILLGFLLGNLVKIPLFRPDILISPLDIAVTVVYIFALLKIVKLKHSLVIGHWTLVIFTFWLLVTLFITATSQNFLSGLAYFLRYCLYIFSYIPLSAVFSKTDIKNLIQALAIMFPAIGLIQYFWFPDLRLFAIYGWDLHYFRVFGTYLDPGFYGLMLFWSLLYLKNIYYWVFGYLVFAFTYSRSSFLSFLTGFVFLNLKIKKFIGNWLIVLLVLLTLVFLPRSSDGEGVKLERTNSVVSRVNDWQKALNIFINYPISGVGFNLLRYQFMDIEGWQTSHAISGIDSSFLFVLVTSGSVGLLLYIIFLYTLWGQVRRDLRLSAFFIGLLVHSFFLNSQFYPPIILLFTLSISKVPKSP